MISWGLDHGITAEFDLVGTRDPSPYLTAPFAIEHMREYGLDAIYAYNHDLAWWAGNMLAEAWGTAVHDAGVDDRGDGERAPPRAVRVDRCQRRTVCAAALEQAGFELPIFAGPHGLETRVSLQIYCDHDDVKRLADAVTRLP